MTVDKAPQRIQQMFAAIARRYDLLNRLLSAGIDRRWRRFTARTARPIGSGPILDVCAGTADLALEYWRQSGGSARVVAADFCRPMLEIGQQKARRAGADRNIEFVEADAMYLPFASERFALVCVAFGLRNVADTDAGLREMVRVCAAGGVVAVLEFSMPTAWPIAPVYRWYFRRVLPWIGQFLARNAHSAYNYLPSSVAEFPQGEAMVARMHAAGLREARAIGLTFGVATLYVGMK